MDWEQSAQVDGIVGSHMPEADHALRYLAMTPVSFPLSSPTLDR